MGYGAIIGAIGSIVGSVIGGVTSKASSGQAAAGAGQKINLSPVSLTDPNNALGQYGQQLSMIPGVAGTAEQADITSNQWYQAMLSDVDPNINKNVTKISNLASSYLSGIIPQDVQDQIQRATAQQSTQGGYGGTQMARNLTARDLGTTSIGLQQLGTSLAGTSAGMARALNPSFTPVSSLLFTPSQLLARTDQANYYNTDIKNQQAIMNSRNALAMAMAQAQGTAGQGKALQSGVSSLFGGSGGSGGLIGSIISKLGRGGGGGGGGGFDFSGSSGGGGQTVGDFMSTSGGGAPSLGATSDFSSLFGGAGFASV